MAHTHTERKKERKEGREERKESFLEKLHPSSFKRSGLLSCHWTLIFQQLILCSSPPSSLLSFVMFLLLLLLCLACLLASRSFFVFQST